MFRNLWHEWEKKKKDCDLSFLDHWGDREGPDEEDRFTVSLILLGCNDLESSTRLTASVAAVLCLQLFKHAEMPVRQSGTWHCTSHAFPRTECHFSPATRHSCPLSWKIKSKVALVFCLLYLEVLSYSIFRQYLTIWGEKTKSSILMEGKNKEILA